MRDLDAGFGHWLAGFADGEGCFLIITQGSPRCVFRIALRLDDEPILRETCRRTGLGRVHVDTKLAHWEVARKADCLGLVALFDRFPLRAKKARDYAIWREAVELWHQRERALPRGCDRAGAVLSREMLDLLRTGKEVGLRQVDLADLAGVDQSTVSRALRGKTYADSPPPDPAAVAMHELKERLVNGRRFRSSPMA